MACIIKAESHRVEYAYLLELEHDDDVLEMYDQPPAIPLSYQDRRGRTQNPLHVADYFVLRTQSSGWVECKSIDDLTHLAESQPQRYQRDDAGRWRCLPGEAYAANLGLTYTVFPSEDINWTIQSNWRYLDEYYQDLDHLNVAQELLRQFQHLLAATPGTNLADLQAQFPDLDYDVFHIAIAQQLIYVDLAMYRLEDKDRTIIPIYRHRRDALANPLPVPNGGQDDVVTPHYLIEPGDPLEWDGKAWQVLNPGATEVTLIATDGCITPLPIEQFYQLVGDGTISGIRTRETITLTDAGRAKLDGASPHALVTAIFRQRVLHPELYDDRQQVALHVKLAAVPQRTRERWRHWERVAETIYGSGFIGLIPNYRACGGPHLSPQVESLIHQVLIDYYDATARKLKRGAYGEYLVRSDEQQLSRASQQTFYVHARHHKTAYEQALARGGDRFAYPFKDPYRGTMRTTNPHGLYAWEQGYIDHTPIDLALRDSETGEGMGKAYLSALVLGHPHRVAALWLSYDPPSYRSCMLLMRLCVRRFERLPTSITVDGGAEFHSVYFEQLLATYRIRKQERPASEPRFGSLQERLFGSLNTEVIYHLSGNTQALKNPRQMSRASNPQKQAVWTLPALAERLQVWAFEEYDVAPLDGLRGLSPRQAYQRSLDRDGARQHRTIAYDDDFVKRTYPSTRKGVATVQPGDGVRMSYFHYWSEAMRDPRVEKTLVPVRYDPFNIYQGYAYIGKQWRSCQCAYPEFMGCSERELSLIIKEVRQAHRQVHGRAQVEITQERLARYHRENATQEVLLRQQHNDREARATLVSLEAGMAPLPPTLSDFPPAPVAPLPIDTQVPLLVLRRRTTNG
jgi:putative transposase